MKIAVFIPGGCPLSMRIYAHSVMDILKEEGYSFTLFKRNEPVPQDVDIYWDPRSGGGLNPYRYLRKVNQPLVVTVHGLALFSMKLSELFDSASERTQARKNKLKYRYGWRRMKKKVSKIITVSNYSKMEVLKYLPFDEKDVVPIWNGYNQALFYKADKSNVVNNGKPYFFTVISYQKKKNFERMIEAYGQIPESKSKPDFIALVKPYDKDPQIKGLKIIKDRLEIEDIIKYYQSAYALVFPTLHEGFGLPIIEAMACGCPVITSNVTAANEVAADAAFKVNPRSVDEIKLAMVTMMDENERNKLFPLMEERVKHFSWDKCAMQHKGVFDSLVNT